MTDCNGFRPSCFAVSAVVSGAPGAGLDSFLSDQILPFSDFLLSCASSIRDKA